MTGFKEAFEEALQATTADALINLLKAHQVQLGNSQLLVLENSVQEVLAQWFNEMSSHEVPAVLQMSDYQKDNFLWIVKDVPEVLNYACTKGLFSWLQRLQSSELTAWDSQRSYAFSSTFDSKGKPDARRYYSNIKELLTKINKKLAHWDALKPTSDGVSIVEDCISGLNSMKIQVLESQMEAAENTPFDIEKQFGLSRIKTKLTLMNVGIVGIACGVVGGALAGFSAPFLVAVTVLTLPAAIYFRNQTAHTAAGVERICASERRQWNELSDIAYGEVQEIIKANTEKYMAKRANPSATQAVETAAVASYVQASVASQPTYTPNTDVASSSAQASVSSIPQPQPFSADQMVAVAGSCIIDMNTGTSVSFK